MISVVLGPMYQRLNMPDIAEERRVVVAISDGRVEKRL